MAKLADAQGLGPCPVYRGVRVQISPRPLMMNHQLLLNQTRAAPYVKEVIDDFDKKGKLSPNFWIFRTSETKEIARHLCLPTASSSAINLLLGKKIIGDKDGDFRVGDFYRLFIPLHSAQPTGLPAPYDQGWWVMDQTGNIFHQAIIAFAQMFNVQAQSLMGFSSIEWIFEKIGQNRAVAVVSVDNRYLLGDNSHLNPGRHSVLVLSLENKQALVFDTFDSRSKIIDLESLNRSLAQDKTRPKQGLVFSLTKINFPEKYVKKIHIPEKVKDEIQKSPYCRPKLDSSSCSDPASKT